MWTPVSNKLASSWPMCRSDYRRSRRSQSGFHSLSSMESILNNSKTMKHHRNAAAESALEHESSKLSTRMARLASSTGQTTALHLRHYQRSDSQRLRLTRRSEWARASRCQKVLLLHMQKRSEYLSFLVPGRLRSVELENFMCHVRSFSYFFLILFAY